MSQTQSPETLDLLLKRRSVMAQNLREPGPNDAELELILRAATRVSDHGKLTPWRLHIFRGDSRLKLGQTLATILQQQDAEAKEERIAFERIRIARSPLVVMVVYTPVESFKAPPMEQLMSCGAVCQNLIIAARALGYGSQWLTEWPAYNDMVRAVFGLRAQDQIAGFIYIGTASETPEDRPRPALADVVTFHE